MPIVTKASVLGIAVVAGFALIWNAGDRAEEYAYRSRARLENRIESLEQVVSSLKQRAADSGSSNSEAEVKSSPQAVSPIQQSNFPNSKDDPFLGDAEAPVTLTMFANYQCAPCRKFARSTLPELNEQFISKGQLQFVFRDMPLKRHPLSVELATLANCAGEQGDYWQAFYQLYAAEDITLIAPLVGSLAAAVGDGDALKQCSTSSRYYKEIGLDKQDAQQLSSGGVPKFLLASSPKTGARSSDAVLIRGAQPGAVFQSQIRAMLAAASNDQLSEDAKLSSAR